MDSCQISVQYENEDGCLKVYQRLLNFKTLHVHPQKSG